MINKQKIKERNQVNNLESLIKMKKLTPYQRYVLLFRHYSERKRHRRRYLSLPMSDIAIKKFVYSKCKTVTLFDSKKVGAVFEKAFLKAKTFAMKTNFTTDPHLGLYININEREISVEYAKITDLRLIKSEIAKREKKLADKKRAIADEKAAEKKKLLEKLNKHGKIVEIDGQRYQLSKVA
jgi:hypothetical protein